MKNGDGIEELARLEFAQAQLKNILLRHMPEQGIYSTEISDVGMARRDAPCLSEHRFDRPLVSLLVQGAKETFIGGSNYSLEAGQVMTVCLDMPSSSRILAASPENPLLTLFFYINPRLIKELWLELDEDASVCQHPSGVVVSQADADFMEAMLRLASILEKPEQIPLRSEIALRDLHYLLLTGAHGRAARDVFALGRHNSHQLFAAIAYLKEHLDRIVGAAELARAAGMSESSLYRHFKALTGISPLQYHKQLRLHKARELIMAGREPSAAAAYKVGYESVSQFSREYKKMFGIPPGRSKKQS